MTPEPYPTPWRWVDLGLPSGTLWLDRNVGADSPEGAGLYFQWGEKYGHEVDSGYYFGNATYEQQGLNLIQGTLPAENDGASCYFGSDYTMPTQEQIQELINNTTLVIGEDFIELVSLFNGQSIKIPNSGQFIGQNVSSANNQRCFSSKNSPDERVSYYYIQGETHPQGECIQILRVRGIPIRPVKNQN